MCIEKKKVGCRRKREKRTQDREKGGKEGKVKGIQLQERRHKRE